MKSLRQMRKKVMKLFSVNSFGLGKIGKYINTTTTSSSDAGLNFYNYYYSNCYSGMAVLGKDVLFNVYERMYGNELWTILKSGYNRKIK